MDKMKKMNVSPGVVVAATDKMNVKGLYVIFTVANSNMGPLLVVVVGVVV